MSLRRKLRKLRHMYKERGKSVDKSQEKSYSGEKKKKKKGGGGECSESGSDSEGNKMNSRKRRIEVGSVCNVETFASDVQLPLLDSIKSEPADEEDLVKADEASAAAKKKIRIKDASEIKKEVRECDWKCIYPGMSRETMSSGECPREVRLCLVEHNYFMFESDESVETTVRVKNTVEADENRTEQQTVELNDSTTKHVDPVSTDRLRKNSRGRDSLAEISVNSWKGAAKRSKCRYLLRERVPRKSPSSDGSRSGSFDVIEEDNPSMTRPASHPGNSRVDEGRVSARGVDQSEVVSLDEIDKEITEMEKLIQSNCEILCEKKKSGGEILPPKLKKITAKADDATEAPKDGDYILPMPNLTKMVPEDKNWNLEYTEDDVKNLGLDDLLLRASELNAENFTKALGQNSGRNPKTGTTDPSDIVLAFPRRGQDDPDASKAKKTKLDFFKRYVKDDKPAKTPEEEAPKELPEASPKRPGIKVKTVQNINEEFKDSLGGKMKNFDGRDISPETALAAKPLYAITDDHPEKPKEVFIPDKGNNSTSLLSCRTAKLSKESAGKALDDAGPFIMTIIQNKDGPIANDHLPAILRSPKVLARSKENFVSEERRPEAKKTDDNGDNVTLLVSEPRTSFEMVNVDDFEGKKGVNYVVHYRNGSLAKRKDVEKIIKHSENGIPIACRKKKIPFILNKSKKFLRMAEKTTAAAAAAAEKTTTAAAVTATTTTTTTADEKRVPCPPPPPPPPPRSVARVVKHAEGSDKAEKSASFSVTSIEKKEESARPEEAVVAVEASDDGTFPKQQVMSLTAFTTILKDILPDKWILSLDKRYGLQIIKTHLDELLNPSIMISVVVGRTGKVTVNVRGRQLEKSHDLFANLCDVGNSNEKISINYILAILNKLRLFNVCFGCDDLSLKKYWCEDGFIEYYTEFQQTYRSHICELLVRLGKKRCYPCYRMHESLKKRKRREQLMKKSDGEVVKGSGGAGGGGGGAGGGEATSKAATAAAADVAEPPRGVKRNLEEFLEESFITMKQKIMDEIEKTKEDEESEKVPKTQDEVLSFMGLTRKDTLDVNLRKSKRERKGFKKCESMIGNNVNKEELYFLEKYWPDINVLFSTSLLIGAYSRTSTGRLREKCRMFHKLLSTWRGIIRDNPIWIGGYMNLADNLVEDEDPLNAESAKEKFERMDIPALRAYIINCVREVNKIKSRLRTKNTYFKVLYNTFVKPRMKKVRQASESGDSPEGKAAERQGAATAKEEDSVDKAEESSSKPSNSTTPTDAESCDEKDEASQLSNGVAAAATAAAANASAAAAAAASDGE